MNNLKEIITKYDFKIKSITYQNKVIILNTTKGKYVYKNNNNYKIYEYLLSRGFTYFPKPITEDNANYEIVEYIDEFSLEKEQKIKDLISITSLLHKKTFFYKELDLNDLKKMYEKMQDDSNYLMNYYNNINDIIDNTTFMSPSMYKLVLNIDLFYYLITFVKVESTNWFNNIKDSKNIRYSLIHGNLDLSHLMENDNFYLISWNKARIDLPYIDLKKILEENYNYFNFLDILNEYQKDNKLDSNEYLFLLINLALPKKVEFTNNTYLDCYNLSNYVEYLKKIVVVIHKYDEIIHKN